jgi:hypothetical protein
MYSFRTIILGTDPKSISSVGEHLKEVFHDEVVTIYIRVEFEEYLAKHKPDIMLIDLSSALSSAEKKNITESVMIIKDRYPQAVLMVYGGKKSTLKDKNFQDSIDYFSGKTVTKIADDYMKARTQAVLKGNRMIAILTGFFAPYLIGNYEQPGFDRLLTATYSRDENLELIEKMKKSFLLFQPLLQEKSQQLIENALNTYPERDLTPEEIEEIQEAFYFQFTHLTAMNNFSDRRRYYAEKDVITNIWESTIDFVREIEDSIIFGCHKLGDTVNLKISSPVDYDLKKISKRSNYYKLIESIEPYGTMTLRSGDQIIYLGSGHPEDRDEPVEGTLINMQFKVVVPARGRRGIKRL